MPITVTTRTSPPSTDLFISSLPTGTVKVRVWRQWNNQQKRVRGDEQAAVISLASRLEDYDLPVGFAVTYTAQCFDSTGAELAPISASSPITVNMADPTTAWVSDPLAPGLALLLSMESGDDSRDFDSDTVYAQIIGDRDPVAISGIRSSAAEWEFTFIGFTYETSTAFEALVAAGGVLLIRTDPTVVRHDTGLIYISAPKVKELRRRDMIAPYRYRSDWVVAGRQTKPPSVSVVMPLREYADMEAENATYQAVIDDFTDYLALLRG